MTILVTGGAGYIGSLMTYELADKGEPVVVLDNLSTGHRFLVPSNVPFVEGDVGNSNLVIQTIKKYRVTAIIHFAASIVSPESVLNPLAYYRNNTLNTCLLLNSAIEAGVDHIIYSSTAAVYGNTEQPLVLEGSPTAPTSPYGTSKLMSETILNDVGRAHKLRFIILRYFNVAGADPKLRTGQSSRVASHLIKVACEAALGCREKVEVFGTDYPTPDGTCVRDYIHVHDLVTAHSAAIEYLRRGGKSVTLNCGYGHGYSVLEVLSAVRRVSGNNFPIATSGRRVGDPVNLVADVSRILATLAWVPQFDDLDTIVGHALAWEQKLRVVPSANR